MREAHFHIKWMRRRYDWGFKTKYMRLNLQNRYAQNRYQQKENLFGDVFHLDKLGGGRPIWSILTLHVMDELAKPLFWQEHESRLIIKIELFQTVLTQYRS
jgi:hypothetical protein